MIGIHAKFPFGVSRIHIASGKYEPSYPIPSPSSVFGFVGSVAGIEYGNNYENAPQVSMAYGFRSIPWKGPIVEQDHVIPASESKSRRNEHMERSFQLGYCYSIRPVKREILTGIEFNVVIVSDEETEHQISKGIRGEIQRSGIPYLGNSNYFADVIEEQDPKGNLLWVIPFTNRNDYFLEDIDDFEECEDDEEDIFEVFSSTVKVYRGEGKKTKSKTFTFCKSESIPDEAWIKF